MPQPANDDYDHYSHRQMTMPMTIIDSRHGDKDDKEKDDKTSTIPSEEFRTIKSEWALNVTEIPDF